MRVDAKLYKRSRGFHDWFYFRVQFNNLIGVMLTVFGFGVSLDLKVRKQEHEEA